MTDASFTETHRTTPRYHCVTQLQKNSWEYREKGNDAPNEDDLVSAEAFDAALKEIDRLRQLQDEAITRLKAQRDRAAEKGYWNDVNATDETLAMLKGLHDDP